jgi:hypothetical protein
VEPDAQSAPTTERRCIGASYDCICRHCISRDAINGVLEHPMRFVLGCGIRLWRRALCRKRVRVGM